MFGLSDNPLDPESLIYRPYNALVPNSEGSGIDNYPISFYNVMNYDGCISFNVKSGSCKTGLNYISTGI
jgi:hypothetical protein